MSDLDLHISREVSSLRQQVTDRLRKAILFGYFEPEERLIERDLCEKFGISRTLLRESLQHLQAEGLILIIPHKGPIVASVDADEAREIYQVREKLEMLIGEGFTLNATDGQVHRLRKALEYLKTPEATGNLQNMLEAKNNFYDIFFEGCGNRVAGKMMKLLNNRVTLLRRLSLAQPGRLPETLRELEAVVAAIEERDAVRAKELCAAHVVNAAKVVARSFCSQKKKH